MAASPLKIRASGSRFRRSLTSAAAAGSVRCASPKAVHHLSGKAAEPDVENASGSSTGRPGGVRDAVAAAQFVSEHRGEGVDAHPLCPLLYLPTRRVARMAAVDGADLSMAQCAKALVVHGGSFVAAVDSLCAQLPGAMGLSGDWDASRAAARALLTALVH